MIIGFSKTITENLSRCVKIKPDTKATASALTVNLDYPGQNFPKNSACLSFNCIDSI